MRLHSYSVVAAAGAGVLDGGQHGVRELVRRDSRAQSSVQAKRTMSDVLLLVMHDGLVHGAVVALVEGLVETVLRKVVARSCSRLAALIRATHRAHALIHGVLRHQRLHVRLICRGSCAMRKQGLVNFQQSPFIVDEEIKNVTFVLAGEV